MNKKKRFLIGLLALILSINSTGSSVFALPEITSGTEEDTITDSSQDLSVEGSGSLGNALASSISEENEKSETRKQSADNITGLEFEDNTAVVEFQTQTDAELVVAVYDEEQLQMLASGKELISKDENMIEISISEEMPQYFIATAYLLDKESHEPLCEEYTTELYTKSVQDLKNSTVEDYDSDKVVQFDEDTKTNFAVFNDETVVADEEMKNNHLKDNGDGTYTITNADDSIKGLTTGDTFSYNYKDGTILLIKVANISVNGTTVTIQEDTSTDLNDYFDYVKIETDSSQGTWSVDNSNLDEGITPAESDAPAAEASRIGASGNLKYSVAYDIDKKFGEQVKVTGSLEYSFSFALDFYCTSGYQYLSLKKEYSVGISVDITEELKIKEISLGRIECPILPCVSVGFTPSFVVETSGKVGYSGELKGTLGGAYDGNMGFKNLSSFPKCNGKINVEGKIFIGIKATPYVAIISADLAKASLELSAGAEATAARTLYDSSNDNVHDCNICLEGEIKSKLSLGFSVDLIKGMVKKKVTFEPLTIKIGDFYYSCDRDKFGWGTCPYINYPVKISVKDKNGKDISGVSTITVTDKESGEAVELRLGKTSFMDSIELKDSELKKVYLPNGSYIVHAVNSKDMKGDANLTVQDKETEVKIKLSGGTVSGKDGNISWHLSSEGTLYIEGQGDMPGYDKSPWSDFSINKVVVQKGITSIGDSAFAYCSSLSSIEIPEGVTSIGDSAFAYCSNLSIIEIPEGVTSIGFEAFGACSSLSNIKIPEGVTSIGSRAFEGCESLSSIEIPEGVTSIGDSAFAYCSSLRSIEIPEGVTSIDTFAFHGCRSLSSIEIPKGVTSIGYGAFFRCSSLRSIEILEGVTSIGERAFANCNSLSSIEIPKGVTSIGNGAFWCCGSLSSIKIPEEVTSIEDGVFWCCGSLRSIEIPERVTSIGDDAFWCCGSLSSIEIPEGVTSIGDSAFANCRSLRSIEIPEGVASIGYGAFADCSSLSSIEIPKNVSKIGVSVFNGCGELGTIYFKGNKPEIIYHQIAYNADLFSGLQDTTVYYPNNKTWEGIESESFGGTNIKWVAYDLAFSAISAGAEVQSSESSAEGVEFTDDVNASETDDPEENPSIEPEDDAEEVPEPSSLPDQEKTDTDEMIEDDFSAGDVEITELDPMISNEQEDAKAGDFVTFSRLIPHSRYLFVMLRDEDADDPLEASNLLYIGQKTADESGTVSFRYMLKESFDSPVPQIFGKQLKDIKNMTITLAKTKYVYDGTSKKPSVTVKDGTKLLRNGQDYTVTYSKNVNVGTATVTVIGKGDYTGTSAVKFVIAKANNTIKASNIIKNTSKKTQTVKIKVSVKDKAKLTYSSNSKSVKVDSSGKVTIAKNFTGKAVITITSAATSKYNKAVVKITVTVRPSGTVLYKLTNNAKGKVKVTWKKNSSVNGYRIQYSTDKNFKKGVGTVTIGKNKITSGTLSKLKKGKTYYVRIATYKKAGDKIYSSWSKVKKIKITK